MVFLLFFLVAHARVAEGFRCADDLFVGPSRTAEGFYQREVGRVVLLPTPARLVRQQCLSSCTLNAALTWLERMSTRVTGRDVRLSFEAFFRVVLVEKTMAALADDKTIELTSFPEDVTRAADRYGVMPESAWTPRRPLRNEDTRIEPLLDRLNAFARLNRDQPPSERLRRRVEKIVYDSLERPPETLSFDGRTYTANAFARRLRLPKFKAYAFRNGRESFLGPFVRGESFPGLEDVEYRASQIMLARVRQLIDRGEPVLGNLHLNGRYVDRRTGVISADFVRFAIAKRGGHSVVFIGYESDPAGQVSGLYFQNSWGARSGVDGIYFVSTTYLDIYDFQLMLPAPG